MVVVALILCGAVTTGVDLQTQSKALLLLDRIGLDDVAKKALRGDPTLKNPVAALEDDARKALSFAPVSVMDKTITPPSGDKHDYMSQAPYWWPDPSKPGGRPYIRKDGERNPEINRLPDHDNLGRLVSAVSTLGLAYHVTHRAEYAAHAARLVRVWFLNPDTRMNPHLNFGQGIPGINEGRGIGIIETRGLPEMLDGVLLIADSGAWKVADRNSLHAWMTAYLRWLTQSPYGLDESKNGNNHETWYDVQVAGLALFTDEDDLARRTLEGARNRIARQIEPDGRQPREQERTRSWDYSIFNLRAFFDLATLGERIGVDLWNYQTSDGRSLRKALDYLVPFAAGERTWPEAQITPFRPGELHPLLRRAAVAWKEPKYRELAMKIGGSSARVDLTVR
jgi:alginate lyase